jgi:lactoylglutathione lyase
MKKLLASIFIASLFIGKSVNAQVSFNHITVYVVDMNKSAEFYEKVMGLERIAEPFHDNRHIWEKIGEHSQLHIVQGAKEMVPHDINIHLAFTVPSVEDFAKRLDAKNIKYSNFTQNAKDVQVRPDGIKQIYFQDPDGYWIEINDDKF